MRLLERALDRAFNDEIDVGVALAESPMGHDDLKLIEAAQHLVLMRLGHEARQRSDVVWEIGRRLALCVAVGLEQVERRPA